jgi:hypothetical protein
MNLLANGSELPGRKVVSPSPRPSKNMEYPVPFGKLSIRKQEYKNKQKEKDIHRK